MVFSKKNYISLLSLIFLPASSMAIDFENTDAHIQTACRSGKVKAELLLRFDKNQPAELREFSGAPLLFLQVNKKTLTVEDLTAPNPGDFSFVPIKENSGCDGTQAFSVGKNILAIMYSKDDRPFQSLYKVALWDSQKNVILSKLELGPVSNYLKTKNGFAFSTVVSRSDSDSIEMTSPSGRKMMAVDKDLEALNTFRWTGSEAKVEFDPELSFEKSPWKKYFMGKDDYLGSIGWSSIDKTIKNKVVYHASYFKRSESNILESCIALTDKRGGLIDKASWKCLKEKQ